MVTILPPWFSDNPSLNFGSTPPTWPAPALVVKAIPGFNVQMQALQLLVYAVARVHFDVRVHDGDQLGARTRGQGSPGLLFWRST